jgi:membrane protein required for colicin V production
MQSYDFLMLAVLIGCMVFGAWKGMAWQVASLASIVASYFAAVNFSGALAPMISAEAPWNKAAAMLILYVATSIGIWLAFRLVAGLIDSVRLREFDRQIGALFGAAKGVLLCLVITFFALSLSETARGMVHASRAGYYMTLLLRDSDPYLPPRVREVLGPYIDQLEDKLNQPGTSPNGPSPSGPSLPGIMPGPNGPLPSVPPSQPQPRPFPNLLSDSSTGYPPANGNDWRASTNSPAGSSGMPNSPPDGSQPGGLLDLGSRMLWEFTGGSQPSGGPTGGRIGNPSYGPGVSGHNPPPASRPANAPAASQPPSGDDWNGIFSRGLDVLRSLDELGKGPSPAPRR